MKKTLMVAIVSLTLVFGLGLRAFAYSDEETQSIADAAGVDSIRGEYIERDELSGDKQINVFDKAITIISDSLKDNGASVLKAFGGIFAVLLISAVMSAMKFGGSESLDNAISYISVLALSGVTYSVIYNLFVLVVACMESLTLAIGSLMPVMASLYAFGGTAAAGAAATSGMAMFLSVLSIICTKILLPMLRIAFAMSISGAVPGSVNLSSVTNILKNTATTLMSFCFGILGFTLYLQTAIASAGDTYITRSVRFATGVFVPVIGSILGDASRTVIASVSVIKGTVGGAGTVLVLSAVLPPLIITALYKIMLLLCAVFAKALGCERESLFLYDIGGIINLLLALVSGAGVVSIIAMAVFIKTGVTA